MLEAKAPANRRSIVVSLFLFFAGVYGLSAWWLGRTTTPPFAYFNYLADAFLHGRLNIVGQPATLDLTPVDGRWYVPFPPLPAILMLPFVAWGGPDGINTVVMACLVGAGNVALVFLLLEAMAERKWSRLNTGANLWLTALFGMGSVHWSVATIGSVWFVSQACTVGCVALAVWIAVAHGRPSLAATALALAVLARPHLALALPLLIGIELQVWRDQGLVWTVRRTAVLTLQMLIPIGLAAMVLLAYNQARFGNPFDFGYAGANSDPSLMADLTRYGQFSLHFVPRNLAIVLFGLPDWDPVRNLPIPNLQGMSLLLTTPAVVYLHKVLSRSTVAIGAWVTTGMILVPLLAYYNTGWAQFGYRFSLDFMVPVMVLLALAVGDRISWTFRALTLLGVAVNLWGVTWFLNPNWPS